eukprot:scaffold401_cov399-Prasinococcus_capsulatus_cf.AAC.4
MHPPDLDLIFHRGLIDESAKNTLIFTNARPGSPPRVLKIEKVLPPTALGVRNAQDIVSELPEQEFDEHFETCALVGNGGGLLLQKHGREIDAHEAVIRINMAPTEARLAHPNRDELLANLHVG